MHHYEPVALCKDISLQRPTVHQISRLAIWLTLTHCMNMHVLFQDLVAKVMANRLHEYACVIPGLGGEGDG